SKRNSTALSVRLTCCPPGPSARRKRSVSSDSGISMEGEMRMPQRLDDSRRKRVGQPPSIILVIPAQAGLRRQDAGANIGAADGPKGELQMQRVIQCLSRNLSIRKVTGSRISLRTAFAGLQTRTPKA